MKVILGCLVLLLVWLLAVLSNWFSVRDEIPIAQSRNKTKSFVEFSRQLQISCANCHTVGLTQYPLYFNLPVAKQLIEQDIQKAQEKFPITPSQLSGEASFSLEKLGKIRHQVSEGHMPPLQYQVLHWESILNEEDKEQLLSFIDTELHGSGLLPLTNDKLPKVDFKKVALGRALYFDKRLSGDDTVSCASCHALEKGGSDQQKVAIGIRGQKGPINTPTVLNAVLNSHQFWDGRAKDLKEQAAAPVTNPKEMGATWKNVLGKLERDPVLTRRFKEVYPKGYTIENITDAIAEYEKTLVTPNSTFDLFLLGDKEALTAEQRRGYQLFLKNGCTSCHSGVLLGGQSFEKMGKKEDYFAWRKRTPTQADMGRFNVTLKEEDKHKFKVPTLRNIELTHPYFHDGSTHDLAEAVQIMGRFQNGKELSKEDATAIAEFLRSTTVKVKD